DTGTKKDLGTVAAPGKGGEVEVEAPVDQKDINAAYDEAVNELARHVEEEPKQRSESEKQEDYYKAFRTEVVLAWTISNAALVAAVTNGSSTLNSILPQDQR
ncbi:18115_t:CDS:1, partial [Racocetra fulgida]